MKSDQHPDIESPCFQCVPNFSEGRRPEVVEAIARTIADTQGVALIDHSADMDHNRCVMTFLGQAGPIRAACLAAARVAVTQIDLRMHQGVHPRVGALDVLPVVPLWGASRDEAVQTARAIGADLASELQLPVYFYEWAATAGRQTALPDIRKGGFEWLASRSLVGDLVPDLGPDHVHPSAGIAVVGARGPLVAYNVDLNTADVTVAQAIARTIRQERDHRPELHGVRALGLFLASRNRAQVSLNLTRPDRTSLPAVFAFVRAEAQRLGTEAEESEIIGAIPRSALAGQSPDSLLWHRYRPAQILENAGSIVTTA